MGAAKELPLMARDPLPNSLPDTLPKGDAALSELRVVLLDCQTSGMVAAEVIEIGWQLLAGAATGQGQPIQAELVAMQEPDSLAQKITALTGITAGQLSAAAPLATVLANLKNAVLTQPAIVVIHYAAFERRFLKELLAEPAVQAVVCSYKLAGRLWPNLPSKSLRSVSGYLGLPVTKLKRSADHIAATAVIWQAALSRLAFEGVHTWGEFTQVLAGKRPLRGCSLGPSAAAQGAAAQGAAAAQKKTYRLPAQVRLSLPEVPGVYHLLAADGRVLYVGKATSLKARVNSYFRGQKTKGSRLNELVSQVADIRFVRVGSSLEAELLEQRYIAAWQPPYNVALVAAKPLYYLDPTMVLVPSTKALVPSTKASHRSFGPMVDAQTAAMLSATLALRAKDAASLAAGDLPELLLARAAWRRCSVAALFEGIGLFLRQVAEFGLCRAALEYANAQTAMAQKAEAQKAEAQKAEAQKDDHDSATTLPWQAEDVCGFLLGRTAIVLRQGHRGRWLRRLRRADLWWTEGGQYHQLTLREDAAIFGRPFDILPGGGQPLPATSPWRAPLIATRSGYDRAAIVLGFIKGRLSSKPDEGLWLRCYPGRLLTAAALRRLLAFAEKPHPLADKGPP